METTALTRDNVKYTKAIRFWSSGKITESAYNRMTELKSNGNEEEARVILDEWIIN